MVGGVLSVVEMEQVVDVDFVVSLLDTPMCEYFANNLAMPVSPDCPRRHVFHCCSMLSFPLLARSLALSLSLSLFLSL